MRDWDWDNVKSIGLTALVIAALIAGVYWAITYRHSEVVVVDGRYWTYGKGYYWDTSYTTWSYVSTCTGTGKNRSCTSRLVEQVHTVTHTRCYDARSGNEWPARAPEMSCTKQLGDYTVERVVYTITYITVKDQKSGQRHFEAGVWDKLQPGKKRAIISNIFGTVLGIEEK